MTTSVLIGSCILQLVSLIVTNRSRRIAPDLRLPLNQLLAGSLIATAAHLLLSSSESFAGMTSALSLISALFLIASVSHFVLCLCTPAFVRSANYWSVLTLLGISVLLSTSLIGTDSIPSASLITTFSSSFGWMAAALCLLLMLVALSPGVTTSTDSTTRFRIRSARRLVLYSLVLSLLLLFSLPATPAMATATATWCSCFVTVSTSYAVVERRLFLYDTARRALNSTSTSINDESIALAASTLDSLGDLLSQRTSVSGALPHAASPLPASGAPLLVSQLRSVTPTESTIQPSPEEAELFSQVKLRTGDETDQLFARLLTGTDRNLDVVSFSALHSQIQSLETLSQNHFGVSIIGNSLQLMDLVSRLRQDGGESRLSIIDGEPGSGKKLFAQALHNMRGNHRLFHIDLSAILDPASMEQVLSSLDNDRPDGRRDTLTVRIPVMPSTALTPHLERLALIQSQHTDVILLIETAVHRAASEAATRFIDAFTLSIPPLRERFEDMILQALWYADSFSERTGLGLRGIEASALRAALIGRWTLNTRELFESINLVLSLSQPPFNRALSSFTIPDMSSDMPVQSGWTDLKARLQEIFLQSGADTQVVADRLGLSLQFVVLLAERMGLAVSEHTQDKGLHT